MMEDASVAGNSGLEGGNGIVPNQRYGDGDQGMARAPSDLYLDLLKKVLTFTLWREPATKIESLNYLRTPFRQYLVNTVVRLLQRKNLQLVRDMQYSEQQQVEGRIWPAYADTMIGINRLDNIRDCIDTILAEGIKGDFIETGVWRGGACIFMRAVLAAYSIEDRKVFVADSFCGLPKPDVNSYPDDKGDDHHIHEFLAVSRQEVESNFRKYGLLDDQVIFLEGWFKDTLPKAPIESLSIMRLDGDMYESTMEALEHLYPKLSPGGFCIIDDYALKRCRKAVDEFRRKYGISVKMETIDFTGRYWRKE
jgi:O-methyltransferase